MEVTELFDVSRSIAGKLLSEADSVWDAIPAIEDYIDRSFTHLMINFGCTGGQHRSVYAADQLAAHIKEKYGVSIKLHHIEQEKKKWEN